MSEGAELEEGERGGRCVRRYSQSGHQSFKKSQLSFSFSRHTHLAFPYTTFLFDDATGKVQRRKRRGRAHNELPKDQKRKKKFFFLLSYFPHLIGRHTPKVHFSCLPSFLGERKFMNAFFKKNREGFISPNDSFSKACVLVLQLSCSAAP